MGRRGRQRSNGDPGYKHRLLAAIKGLEDGTYPNVTQAAQAERVHFFGYIQVRLTICIL